MKSCDLDESIHIRIEKAALSDHFSLVLPDLTFIEGVEGDDSILNLLYALVAKGTEHDEKVLSYIIRLVMSQI